MGHDMYKTSHHYMALSKKERDILVANSHPSSHQIQRTKEIRRTTEELQVFQVSFQKRFMLKTLSLPPLEAHEPTTRVSGHLVRRSTVRRSGGARNAVDVETFGSSCSTSRQVVMLIFLGRSRLWDGTPQTHKTRVVRKEKKIR